jgi:Family of unknown function (DUF5397)
MRQSTAPIFKPDVPANTIKSFGPFGPKYKVGSPVRALTDGDWMMEVEVLESGERLEYRLSNIHDDPEAQ